MAAVMKHLNLDPSSSISWQAIKYLLSGHGFLICVGIRVPTHKAVGRCNVMSIMFMVLMVLNK